jgi:amino acid adenylation domain-containing protein
MHHLLQHLLDAATRRHPDAVAIVDGERELTYAALDRRANALANLLLDEGVRRGDRVGIHLEKSLESVVAIYGVMRAGAAYVPLDAHAPASRIGSIARNAGIRLMIAGAETAARAGGLIAAGAPLDTVVVVNAAELPAGPPAGVRLLTAGSVARRPMSPPRTAGIDLDLAYVLYTSGSTGEPKGVMLTHRNALTFVDWAARLVGVTTTDRLSSHAPLHFDLSIFDLFAAAAGGAAVVLVPPETSVLPRAVADFIRDREITIWYSVPSVLSMLALRGGLQPGDCPSLRAVLFAGEVFPAGYLRRLMAQVPAAAFYNLYGPTETNVCTYYEVPPLAGVDDGPIPIGKAIDNVEVFAAGEDGMPVRRGEVGELWVRGSSVMRGYWRDPERTARALVADPRPPGLADPAYRTGDLVREGDDGDFEFLGRRDAQIKSRGYRIELGDVEAALYAHPSVVECAVTAVPDELVTNRLKAHVVLRDERSDVELLRFCAERIPAYMVPELVERRDQLPRTSTGKVDRRALSAETTAVGG